MGSPRLPPGGTVIFTPEREHHCNPGWEWKKSVCEGLFPLPSGTVLGVPPDPSRFPPGTLWRCDCGMVWVSTGSPAAVSSRPRSPSSTQSYPSPSRGGSSSSGLTVATR